MLGVKVPRVMRMASMTRVVRLSSEARVAR